MGVLRRATTRRRGPSVEDRIRDAIDALRPLVRTDTSGIELARFDARRGVAVLRVHGGCPDCDMTAAMLIQGIEAHLRMRVPEVRAVEALEDDPSRHA